MAAAVTHPVKIPWHLWAVGVVAVLWNAMGVLDFTLTELKNETYLKQLTPQQLASISNFPVWSVVSWGAGVYGGFVGSILLLARQRSAVPVFLISIAGVILTSLYSYVLSDTMKQMNSGAGGVIFSATIFVVALLLWVHARKMFQGGVLR